MSENAAGQGPLERPVGPHLPPDTWHWVQFETMDGDRTDTDTLPPPVAA